MDGEGEHSGDDILLHGSGFRVKGLGMSAKEKMGREGLEVKGPLWADHKHP